MKNYFFILLGVFAFTARAQAQCDTTQLNGNMTISSSVFMSGVYMISGDFYIPQGITVFVQGYENGGCGVLEIHAERIVIEGNVNGDYAGFPGGIGGAPGMNVTSLTGDMIAINDCSNKDNTGQVTVQGGSAGTPGQGPGGGNPGTAGGNGSGPKQQCLSLDDEAGMIGGAGGAGGGSGGSYGGMGSVAGNGGAGAGTYQSSGLNVSTGFPVVGGSTGIGGSVGSTYGTESGEDIHAGSGGAGAGGGGRSYDSGLAGGNGGNGGGLVRLIAQDSLIVSGMISVNGAHGSNGGDGGNGGTSPKCCSDGCDDCGEATLSTGAGGGAGSGGGSGGGILLKSATHATITGILESRGGNGGSGGLRGNGVSCEYDNFFCGTQSLTSGNGNPGATGGAGGGGRIKVFVPICSESVVQPTTQLTGGSGAAAGQNGTYYVGCSELSLMEHQLEAQILVYPNPATDAIRVAMPTGNHVAQVRIVDLSGRIVVETTAQLSADPIIIPLSLLETGNYQLCFLIDGMTVVKRFIHN